MPSSSCVPVTRVVGDNVDHATRDVPEESPVAIVHDGTTYGVMMATPADLEDFGVGLSFTEGVIENLTDVTSIDTVETDFGFEVRLWLTPGISTSLLRRRRLLFGPTGCGLCGVESLQQATRTITRPIAEIEGIRKNDIHDALFALQPEQRLGKQTRAVHAAGFWLPDRGLVIAREDVGRHNAVDKIAGALARNAMSAAGVLVLTSRVSVELIQKASAIGMPVVVAVSAPTRLAVALAESVGITLVAVARRDGFEVFTHPNRIIDL